MDAEAFRDAVEDAKRAELDRLGSDSLLVALTGSDPTSGAVLRAAANSENAARNTFASWAADERDDHAREAFATTAEQEADHRDRVLAELAEPYDPADGGPMHEYLRRREETVQRVAAGMVGRSLVSLRTHSRIIQFFEDRGETTRTDLFRALRVETGETLETGLDLLDELCTDEIDWEHAEMVATYVVQVAYDDYADALRGMGIDPESGG